MHLRGGARTRRASRVGCARVTSYLPEIFSDEERARLAPFVTDVDAQVFGLVGLDQEVAAALFARYSRTARSLRRTLLEEFLAVEGSVAHARGAGRARADALLARVIGDYGDDSVAQLAVVHVGIEQVPALLARRIERGRLASYLEQSTRYVPLVERRRDGSRPAFVPVELAGATRERYLKGIEASFAAYERVFAGVKAHLAAARPPKDEASRRAQRAAALDAARGLLPLATLTNVGVVASAQAAERLVWRLRAEATPGAAMAAEGLARVLRVLVPGLTQRMDREDRGGRVVEYLSRTRGRPEPPWRWEVRVVDPEVRLAQWDPRAEEEVAAWILFERGEVGSPSEGRQRVGELGPAGVDALWAAYVGDRSNRRHLPGRALEVATYEVVISCDVGALRDLGRHRMLTFVEPPIVPGLGFSRSELVEEAGLADDVVGHLRALGPIVEEVRQAAGPDVARLLLPFATQVRFGMVVNARELMHLVELRSQPQGHEAYRRVAVELWRSLEAVGHHRLAAAMSFVDTQGYTVGRLEAERRSEAHARAVGKDRQA